jgi:hypothetical protein
MAGCGSSSGGNGSVGDAGSHTDGLVLLFLDAGSEARVGDAHDDIDAQIAPDGATKMDATKAPDVGPPGTFFTIPLESQQGVAYGVTVTVGGQSFDMDIDTGSTTVGVAASGCTTCSSVGVSPLYAPGRTAVDTQHSAMAQYEDGSGWTGEIYDDTVGLAHGTPNVQLDFVAIATQQQFFQDDSTQGIFGLGPIQNAESFTGSYVAEATAAGITDILAFELCSASGTMWLGGYDPTAANTPVEYTPMIAISDNNPYYAINVDSMALGTTSLGSSASVFQEPVIDTGTSLFYVPTPVFTAIVNAINASSGWTSLFGTATLTNGNEDCVSSGSVTSAMLDASLPAMTFGVPSAAGGADFTLSLSGSQYFFDDGQGDFCLAPGDGGSEDGATFGDAFMTAFLTVVDIQGQRIGFAPATGCSLMQERPMPVHPRKPRHPHRPHRVAR